jgi:hypothetical protein
MSQSSRHGIDDNLGRSRTEADERIDRLYGKPATSDQIRLHFETLVKAYIEGAEGYPADTRLKLHWYTHRPLLFRFFANKESVFFTLVGKADKEGAESATSVEELPEGTANGSVILTSGTSFNGQKVFSIESAFKEAASHLAVELRSAQVPSIITDVRAAGKELKKPDPDIRRVRKVVDQACDRLRVIEADGESKEAGILAKPDSCPFIAGHLYRVGKVESDVRLLEKEIENMNRYADRLSEDSKALRELLRTSLNGTRERVHLLQGRRGLILMIIGILVSIGIGVANIIINFFHSEGG